MASRCGVDSVLDAGKVVWCEICASEAPPANLLSVEDLLTLWSDGESDPDGPGWLPRQRDHPWDDGRTIVVPDLPTGQLIAAKVHMEDVLRELQLMLVSYPGNSSVGSLPAMHLARRLVAAAEDFGVGIRQVRAQALKAAEAGDPLVTLRLRLPATAASAAIRYRDALAEAAQLPATRYLTDPLSSDARIRTQYLNSVIEQLQSA